MKDAPLWYRRLKTLRWTTTPSKILPHGIFSVISLATGFQLMAHVYAGNLEPFSLHAKGFLTASLLPVYLVSTTVCAGTGLVLTRHSQKRTRDAFWRMAVVQLCWTFYMARFTPHCTAAIRYAEKTILASSAVFLLPVFENAVLAIDSMACIVTLTTAVSFFHTATEVHATSPSQAIAISIATCVMMANAPYAIQLIVWGQKGWWECLQDRYPLQAQCFSGIVYMFMIQMVNLVLFGATLLQRKVISPTLFAVVILVLSVGSIGGASLVEEYRYRDAATQRLIAPCMEPAGDDDDAFWWLVQVLDVSAAARRFLAWVGVYEHDGLHPYEGCADGVCRSL